MSSKRPTLGSLFTGCGGMDLGFMRAGFETLWGCEIDKKARGAFHARHKTVPIHEDIRLLSGASLPPVDVVAFGSPCQDLSVAGKQKGLEGERSGLFFEALRVLDELPRLPGVCVWENVAGALSSNRGRDFGRVLYEMGKRWPDVGYRVLDLQYWGVPQRRRRVFVVATNDPARRRAGEILSFGDCLCRDLTPRRTTREDFAHDVVGSLEASGRGTERIGETRGQDPVVACYNNTGQGWWTEDAVTSPIRSGDGQGGGEARKSCAVLGLFGGNNTAGPIDVSSRLGAHEGGSGFRCDFESDTFAVVTRGRDGGTTAECSFEFFPALRATDGGGGRAYVAQPIAFHPLQDPIPSDEGTVHALGQGGTGGQCTAAAALPDLRVRRLTPTECERLMGWPDGFTEFALLDGQTNPVRLKDGPRYKMIGNGVGSPVAEWLAKRILAISGL